MDNHGRVESSRLESVSSLIGVSGAGHVSVPVEDSDRCEMRPLLQLLPELRADWSPVLPAPSVPAPLSPVTSPSPSPSRRVCARDASAAASADCCCCCCWVRARARLLLLVAVVLLLLLE